MTAPQTPLIPRKRESSNATVSLDIAALGPRIRGTSG